MSEAAAASTHVDGSGGFGETEGGFAQRALAWIERAGNKVPNPAILFLGLCIGVVVLSQILDWLGVSVTSEVADPPDAMVEERFDDASAQPSYNLPDGVVDGESYTIETETFEVKGLLTADGSGLEGALRRAPRRAPRR